ASCPAPDDHGSIELTLLEPQAGASFAPGETVTVRVQIEGFDLVEPSASTAKSILVEAMHGDDDHADEGEHAHEGHYRIYLDDADGEQPHVKAWTETAEYELPADIAPGPHSL